MRATGARCDLHTAAEAERRITESLRGRLPTGSTLSVACWEPRLETVIEQGLRETHPERFPAIDQFLSIRVEPPRATGKEAVHSFCAGWRPDSFGDDFYGDVLREPAQRASIEVRMPRLVGHLTRLISR